MTTGFNNYTEVVFQWMLYLFQGVLSHCQSDELYQERGELACRSSSQTYIAALHLVFFFSSSIYQLMFLVLFAVFFYLEVFNFGLNNLFLFRSEILAHQYLPTNLKELSYVYSIGFKQSIHIFWILCFYNQHGQTFSLFLMHYFGLNPHT